MTSQSCDCGQDDEVVYYNPLREALDLISNKYTMETISVVDAHEPARFATIEDHLPEASSSTVSDRLSELGEAGLISRTQYEEIPPRVEYELTGKGRALRQSIEPLLEWAEEYEEG
ncbi:MAG: winged helix-turn-helix transcriptional regulator [Haloferacaceae archaeon]